MLDDVLVRTNFIFCLSLSRSDRHVRAFLLCAELMGCAVP